jgi:hypothetical protein
MNNEPICNEYFGGTKIWVLNNRRHREDGPAVERGNGTKEWWIRGERHREDGPAIEYNDQSICYYLNSYWYEENDYWQELFNRGLISGKELFLKLL